MTLFRIVLLGSIALLSSFCSSGAEPQSGPYGSDITLTVAADVGGGYDIYARTIAPYLKRHLPGNPNIIVQNLPGLGGVRMANHLFNDARKDGSFIGLTLSPVVLSQLMHPAQVRYDANKFIWIGTIEAQTNVLSVWAGKEPSEIDRRRQEDRNLHRRHQSGFVSVPGAGVDECACSTPGLSSSRAIRASTI